MGDRQVDEPQARRHDSAGKKAHGRPRLVPLDDALAAIDIPHPTGDAVSLIERQVRTLRDQADKYRRQLEDLVNVARDNDALARRLHRLTLALIETHSFDEVLNTLQDELREQFKADAVEVVRFSATLDPSDGVVVDISDTVSDSSVYTPEMIESRVDLHDGDILLIKAGWYQYGWNSPDSDEFRYMIQHPGPSPEFADWIVENTEGIRKVAEATDPYVKLKYVDYYLANKFAYLRFNYRTGDAAGIIPDREFFKTWQEIQREDPGRAKLIGPEREELADPWFGGCPTPTDGVHRAVRHRRHRGRGRRGGRRGR